MSLCNSPQKCECAFCDPTGPDAEWRAGMIKAGDEQLTARPTCDCQVCASGQAVNVQEWRKTDPRHEKIYQALIVAPFGGEIKVQGA